MPLCHLVNANDLKLRYTETKLIQFFHPKLNYPFLRKYQTGFDDMNSTTRIVRGVSSMSSARRQKKRVNDLVKAFPNIIMEKDTHVDVQSRSVAMQLMCSRRKGVKGMQALKKMEIDSLMKGWLTTLASVAHR